MAATSFSKIPLSTSTSGQQILITATTSGSATPIHTSYSDTNLLDELYIYAYNDATSSVQCSILWGGISEPTNVNRAIIPPKSGRVLIVDGKLIQNGTVSAYAQVPNVITMDGFCNRITSGSFNVIDPFVTNWVNRVVTNGGAVPSINTQIALTSFYNSLISNNLFDKMITVNCIVPDNLSASLTPFVCNIGNSLWTNHNFISGDLTVNGLIGNASNKYVQTGVIPISFMGQPNSGGYTIYFYTCPSEVSTELASYDGSNQTGLWNLSGTVTFDCWNFNDGATSVSLPGFCGYVSGNRTSSSSTNIYVANSTTTHYSAVNGSGAPGTPPNKELWAWAMNANSSPSYYSSKRLSFIAVHSGLTSSQSLAFYNAIQSLRQNLGGGYV